MRLVTMAAATAALMLLAVPAGAQSLGAPTRISGPACASHAEAVRMVRLLVINAPVMGDYRAFVILAEREGLRCEVVHGRKGIFAGSRIATIGTHAFEVIHTITRPGVSDSMDLFGWRPLSEPGKRI